jgi:predicted  nucleic acid-binding Zn-ribbon protein
MSKKKKCTHKFRYTGKPRYLGNKKFLVKICTKCGTEKFEKVKE